MLLKPLLGVSECELADPRDPFVRSEMPNVFGGTLITVTWHSGKDGRPVDSFVFFEGKEDHFFSNPADLTRFLSARRSSNGLAFLLKEAMAVGGVPAILALIVTATICHIALKVFLGDFVVEVAYGLKGTLSRGN